MRHRVDTEALSRLLELALHRVVFDPFHVCHFLHGFADRYPTEIRTFLRIQRVVT